MTLSEKATESFIFVSVNILYFIDILGTMVFAISGALAGRDKQLDFFGIAAVGFITAIGGGTVRDVLLGSTPVGWMNDLIYLAMITAGVLISLLFGKTVRKLRRTFFIFDTVGIAVFTVLGLQKALTLGVHPIIAIMMGMVSAVFGGAIRDIVCNDIPLIFRKEIYALTCLAGGALYVILALVGLDQFFNVIITVCFIVSFRMLAVKYEWQLPELKN
ncbi:putative membrane protein YeiH [Marinoscillum furvescens DSM 4134]|uniref:Putative membrane protein YeiH n=1 Tax=Marinoscillum furvescens DSM 4134 TaxID=1122208 RepID=A0A3D9LJE6_MARFU|nr:putative membrane protein YeiH [Marinoscillum furvescens DSM 4134]